MHVKILGCHGGETPEHLTTCFLINQHISIDAGALCRSLTLDQQSKIDHILISHSHMDHVKDLALLADQVIGQKNQTIQLHCGPKTAKTLQDYYFNNFLWPDFTAIPTPENPVMKIITQEKLQTFTIEANDKKLTIKYVPVNHPVESMAMIINDQNSTFAYTSDTGPTKLFWQELNNTKKLKALFCEISFPNAMQQLADVSGHFTPASLKKELRKWDAYGKVPLYLYHLKPGFEDATIREIEALSLKNMKIMQISEEFSF